MKILVSNTSSQPIYGQIVEQLKEAILTGEIKGGEMLPSIRSLAKDLKISVITTKRAYDELEKEGLITTVAGKGCFVQEKNESIRLEEFYKRIEEHLSQALVEAKKVKMSNMELLEMFNLLMEDKSE